MTEWETPSHLTISRLETWSRSHAMACLLSKSVSFHRGGMIRTSWTVAKCYKATNVTTFHTQGQLLHVHHAVFHLTWVLRMRNIFKLRLFCVKFCFVCHHTVRYCQSILWKWYADSATPTHCSTRIHSNFVSVENKTEFMHT